MAVTTKMKQNNFGRRKKQELTQQTKHQNSHLTNRLLISDDEMNNNHPVSTITDAAQHMAGEKRFCKIDCSQTYHCLQMTDKRSIEMLVFNFASRTFAFRQLAEDPSWVQVAFSSFMRKY